MGKDDRNMLIKIIDLIKKNKVVSLMLILGTMLLAGSYIFFSVIYIISIAPPKFLSSKTVQYRILQIKLPEITYNYYYSDFQRDILKYKSLSVYQDFIMNDDGAAVYLNDFSFNGLELTEGRSFSTEDKDNKTNTVMISETLLTKCKIVDGKKKFYFDGKNYDVIGVYKEKYYLPEYYINMFAENLSHNIFNGDICIDGNKEEIVSLMNSIKDNFGGKNNGIDISQTEDYKKHDLIFFLYYLLVRNTVYTLIILTPLILLFINVNRIIRYSLKLRYNELYSRFISGASINRIKRQLVFEVILLSMLINLIFIAAISIFRVKDINIIYFSLYSVFFYTLIIIITLKNSNILSYSKKNKSMSFDSCSIIFRTCKFFVRYIFINLMSIMLMVIVCLVSGLAIREYIVLDEVKSNISNIAVYNKLYSIKRSSEDGNYSLNIIYTEDELRCNKLMYKFLEDNYTVYSCYPAFEAKEEKIDGKLINKYFYNSEFKKDIMQKFAVDLSDETKAAKETGLIPIVLGWNYHGHKLGEVINNRYVVCGIIKADAFFYDLKYTYDPIYMDDLIFEYINTSKMDMVDYSFLISDIKIITDDSNELSKINDYADKIGMDRFEIIKDADRINDFKNDFKIMSEFEYYTLICIISLILVLIYVYTYLKIKETKKQIEIMHIIGIPYNDLLFSMLSELLIHIVLIVIIVTLINGSLNLIISVAWWNILVLLLLYLGSNCMFYISLFRGEFKR